MPDLPPVVHEKPSARPFGDVRSSTTAGPESAMDRQLGEIDTTLSRIALLATQLRADPDEHVGRSIEELRSAFATRGVIESAVARLRASVTMLRSGNRAGGRREFQRRALGLDQLGDVIEQELLPELRRLGFEL